MCINVINIIQMTSIQWIEFCASYLEYTYNLLYIYIQWWASCDIPLIIDNHLYFNNITYKH